MLQRYKYRIKVLNTINFKKSMKYNPFAYLRSEKDILKLVNLRLHGRHPGMHPPCAPLFTPHPRAPWLLPMQAAVEWASLGVRVNCVAPRRGGETPAMREMGFPPGWWTPSP